MELTRELRNRTVVISPVKVQNATQKEKEDTVQHLESVNESEEESPGHIDEEHLKTSRSKDGGHHVPQGEYNLDNNAKEGRLKTKPVKPTQLAEHQREQEELEEHIDRGQEHQQQNARTTLAPTDNVNNNSSNTNNSNDNTNNGSSNNTTTNNGRNNTNNNGRNNNNGRKTKNRSRACSTWQLNRIGLHNIVLMGLVVVCCFIIFVFIIYIISTFGRSQEDKSAPSSKMPNDANDSLDYEKIFNNSLTEMKSGFPNQTSRFWLILTNRGLAHLRNSNPKQPLVIMLGAPPSAHTVVDCLAMRLARSLDPERKLPNVFNGSDYSESDGHVTKKLLDTKLDELFRKGVRSVLVLRLDRLPHPSPVLFYSYCDSETAPYKHPAIIFTVHFPEEPSPSLRPVEAEGLVEKYLAEVVWHKEEYDGIAALLSRVADTVALVSGEGEDVLRTECKRN